MLLMELGQFWMIFTIGVSWLCLIPAKSVQTVYIAPVFFIALEVMGWVTSWLLTVSPVLQSMIKLSWLSWTSWLSSSKIICNCLYLCGVVWCGVVWCSVKSIIPRIFVAGKERYQVREVQVTLWRAGESWGEADMLIQTSESRLIALPTLPALSALA